MKKKLFCYLLLAVLLFNGGATPVLANGTDVIEVKEGTFWIKDNDVQSKTKKETKRSRTAVQDETFEKKTEKERAALPKEEKAIVDNIEQYLNEQAQSKGRSLIGDVLDDAVVSLAFEFGFKRENALFNSISSATSGAASEENECIRWFEQLTNVSERTLTVFDEPTGKNIVLRARYIDNGSDRTIILHNGYRASSYEMYKPAKFCAEEGYNVLLPDIRSHNSSEGEYITFGHYEKDDLNKWIDQEAEINPQQDIFLLGASMGAATTMLSQATPNPNVKAYIEDCGYDTLEQQLRDTLHLLTQYFEYIPIVNWMDWYKKEGELIQKLNEQKVKPILKFDLYTVSPFESVAVSGLPKLFIHGAADWFIPPIAEEKLYGNAIGYKEQLIVPGAGHAESFDVAGETYKQTVLSFIKNVYAMDNKIPVVAPDVNLLKNTTFNADATNFTDWETSTTFDNAGFTQESLSKNSYDEFVLKKSGNEDLVTALQYNDGIRFYTLYGYNDGLVGQNVAVDQGETYALSFNAKNETNAFFTYPNVLYGIDDIKKDDSLRSADVLTKTLQYTADATKEVKVKVGAKLGYYAFYDFTHFSHSTINNLQFINVDRTPPANLMIGSMKVQENSCTIQGIAESNSKILVENQEGTSIFEGKADAAGHFNITLSKEQGVIFHLVNVDVKGNRSQSSVFIFQ
jgi:fermentation-respiration switch protein FrsA (DUF1100 family)